MKNFYNIKLLLLVCLFASFGFLISCDDNKDAEPNNGQAELLSFGPTGAKHGEEIRFVGYNLNKVESIVLPGVTVSKASFIEQSSELIRLIVPQETMAGKVTLKLNDGTDIVSKTVLSFEVPITLTTITSSLKPGTNLTITGTKLNWVKGVAFEKDTVKQFISQTATQIVLQAPLTAKTSKLVIIGGGTEPSFVETPTEIVFTVPTITSMAPNPVSNGSNLTITGTNLDLVKTVSFTGVGAANVTNFVSKTATELVVAVPANASKGKVKVVAMSGVEVTSATDLTLVLPAVTALSPTSVKHSENLTITGTNLDLVKEIKFTGVGEAKVVKASFVSQSATSIVVAVPNNTSKGTIKLVSNSGVEVTTTQEVTVTLPAITTLAPAPVDPGQNLTINGTNLDLVKSIEFQGGTKVTSFVSQTPTKIVVQVPMNAKKGVLKLMTIKDYAITTDAQVTIILPVISSVSPEPVVVGSYLTINGTDLNLVKSVVFTGGATVSSFTAQNSNQIVLLVPAAAKSGILKLITNSDFEVVTDKQAQIGTAVPNISYYIFENALNTTWQQWGGWGTTVQDLANSEQVSRGAKSIKVSYNDAYGALQLHPNSANVFAGYSHLVLYVYGGAGDNRMAIQIKTSAGTFSAEPTFTLKAGEWQKVEIPISSFGDISSGVAEFMVKNYGTNPNTIYIDDMGLR